MSRGPLQSFNKKPLYPVEGGYPLGGPPVAFLDVRYAGWTELRVFAVRRNGANAHLPLNSAKAFAQQPRITAARTCRIQNNLPLIVNPRMAGKAGLGSPLPQGGRRNGTRTRKPANEHRLSQSRNT
jgi:hypothetical protein